MYHDAPIGRLIDDAIEHLRDQGLSEATLTAYRNVWLQVELYMDQHNLQFYDPEVGEGYLQGRLKDLGIAISEKWAYKLSMLIRRLNEFWKTGSIHKRTKLSPSLKVLWDRASRTFLVIRFQKTDSRSILLDKTRITCPYSSIMPTSMTYMNWTVCV